MVCHTVGWIVLLEAVLLVPSLLVSLLYRNTCTSAFLITIGIALALGGAMLQIARPRTKVIYAKEGFAITTLAWLLMSLIGALPFFLSGQSGAVHTGAEQYPRQQGMFCPELRRRIARMTVKSP